MERQSSPFEYLCRVCAANTKGKNSVAECVYILKTPALKDKIEKYLYLTISEDDILPKVLCKACFRQVEATASLSKIAKHTQKVFRDFIFNTKSCLQSETSETNSADTFTATEINTTSTSNSASTATNYVVNATAVSTKAKEKPSTKPTKTANMTSTTCSHKDEVVVNVSVNDPLTRETQHKMISASRRRNSSDSFTPKSIAQRAFSSTPKQRESISPIKKQSAPGVINFFPGRPHQVTTITSGGYVIGCATKSAIKSATEFPASTLKQKRKNLKIALNNIQKMNGGQVSLLKASQKPILQQQPRKSKSSNPPTLLVEDDVPTEPLPEKMIIAATKHQKQHVYAERETCAVSESKPPSQTEPTDLSQPSKPNIPDDILLGKVIKDGDLLKLILKALKWPVTKQTMETQLNRLKNSRFAQIMADPNLLQDPDLTQIMGPYLGPVLQAAQMLQQQQQIAAAVAAATITKTTELKMTAGLTTTLPYKLPAETSVQLVPASPEAEEESDSITIGSASAQSLKRDRENGIARLTPPKKVRKVTPRQRSASIFNSDEYTSTTADLSSHQLSSKSTPDFHSDPSMIFAQLDMMSGLSVSNSNDALLELLQRQRAALTRLQRPSRPQRRNSIITVPASGSDLAFDADDIILMEPYEGTGSVVAPAENNYDGITDSNSTLTPTDSTIASQIPPMAKPMITRPIIKRRKTVIQASPARMNLAIDANEKLAASTPAPTSVVAETSKLKPAPIVSKQTQSLDNTNSTATQYPPETISIGTGTTATQYPPETTSIGTGTTAAQYAAEMISIGTSAMDTQYQSETISIGTQMSSVETSKPPAAVTSKATETMVTCTASATTSTSSLVCTDSPAATEISTSRSNSASRKQTVCKSTLGQQLLEAIGLQKVCADAKDVNNTHATFEPRCSVQQIRSALKKSLQKAQEEQQQRNKQEASSTTSEEGFVKHVNIVREVVVEPSGKSTTNTEGDQVDVEEEINKITLVLQSKSQEDEKIEAADKRLTAAAATRIPGLRRKTVPIVRNRKSAITLVADDIVDLVADEDNQDAAEGRHISKKIDNVNNKETEKTCDDELIFALPVEDGDEQKDSKALTPMRKRGRKLKPEGNADKEASDKKERTESKRATSAQRSRSRLSLTNCRNATSEHDFEKDTDDTASIHNDNESNGSTIVITRPSRISKTMSKYYKGPGATTAAKRRLTMSTRSTKLIH